jgi:hypothetical protein
MPTQREDAEAFLLELEARLSDASPALATILAQQIENVRSALAAHDDAVPSLESLKRALEATPSGESRRRSPGDPDQEL